MHLFFRWQLGLLPAPPPPSGYKQSEGLVAHAVNEESTVSFGGPNANFLSTLLVCALFFETGLGEYISTFIHYFYRREQGLPACNREGRQPV